MIEMPETAELNDELMNRVSHTVAAMAPGLAFVLFLVEETDEIEEETGEPISNIAVATNFDQEDMVDMLDQFLNSGSAEDEFEVFDEPSQPS